MSIDYLPKKLDNMKKHLIFLSLLLLFLSCSEKPSGNVESFWDDLDVVAEKVVVDGDSAILCDYNKIKGQERKTIPFSLLFSDYEVVKLDNDNDKALLSTDISPIALSENYIGCYCYQFYPFKLFLNCFISLFLYFKYQPDYIVTTGAHTAGPMCCIGKIFGSKIIYIESFANIKTKTITGTLFYKFHIANLFIVQWRPMLKLYPKATYGGWCF